MCSQRQDSHSSPLQLTLRPLSTANIPSSNYLRVPETRRPKRPLSRSIPDPDFQDDTDISLIREETSTTAPIPSVFEPSRHTASNYFWTDSTAVPRPCPLSERLYMSIYSTSSVDTDFSDFSNPPARTYRISTSSKMPRKITTVEKAQYIEALRTHQVNTLVELRRIEKAFALLGTPDVSEPMTAAWSYYVDSHGLLTELRGMTKNYPFSSHCLDEAKSRVYSDPESNRSWNLCWLVLSKVRADQLVPYYARYQASQPTMWGGHKPSAEQISSLTDAFVTEWNYALSQMLRHWDQPPTR